MTAVEAKAAASAARSRYDREAGFASIEADFPGWSCWEGAIAGVLYARLPDTSPPQVVRAFTLAGLRAEVELASRGLQ